MRMVAIISRKAGTGKPTLACSLAVAAQCTGRADVALDTYTQGVARLVSLAATVTLGEIP